MSKPVIIAAAFSALLLSAAPAVAQTAAPTVAQTPPAPATINLGSLGKVDPATAPGPGKGFGGRHGSATNLRDAPRDSGTESRPGMGILKATPQDPAAMRKPTLYMRKSGDDKRQDGRPAGSSTGLTKSGPGALQAQPGKPAAGRAQTNNNLRHIGLANTSR